MNLFEDLFSLQRIDYLIRARATGSPRSFASRLEVSECTLYRLIERLKTQGLPIVYDKTACTYYYAEDVKWNVEFIVGDQKLISIKGGKNI